MQAATIAQEEGKRAHAHFELESWNYPAKRPHCVLPVCLRFPPETELARDAESELGQ